MSQYFPKPYRSFAVNVKVELDLSSHATKLELKEVTVIGTSNFALKTNLASLKSEVSRIDVDKLKTVPLDLGKLSNAVKNEIVKKTVYDMLVTKVNNIDTTGFALKNKYDTDKSDLEKKLSNTGKRIPDTSGLVKKKDLNAKIPEIEGNIPDISNLAKKTYYNTKISKIENKVTNHDHDKYITTSEFNKLTAEFFKARLAQTNLVTKTDFDAKS